MNILVYRDDEYLVLQCLEYDIAAQGRTLDEARAMFFATMAGAIARALQRGRPPLADLPRAPREFWRLLERRGRLLRETMPIARSLPRTLRRRLPAGTLVPDHADLAVAV